MNRSPLAAEPFPATMPSAMTRRGRWRPGLGRLVAEAGG